MIQLIKGPKLEPLFPVGGNFTKASTCGHNGPIKRGSVFCCMVCHQSGFDHIELPYLEVDKYPDADYYTMIADQAARDDAEPGAPEKIKTRLRLPKRIETRSQRRARVYAPGA